MQPILLITQTTLLIMQSILLVLYLSCSSCGAFTARRATDPASLSAYPAYHAAYLAHHAAYPAHHAAYFLLLHPVQLTMQLIVIPLQQILPIMWTNDCPVQCMRGTMEPFCHLPGPFNVWLFYQFSEFWWHLNNTMKAASSPWSSCNAAISVWQQLICSTKIKQLGKIKKF
jgi:hypothetical protein